MRKYNSGARKNGLRGDAVWDDAHRQTAAVGVIVLRHQQREMMTSPQAPLGHAGHDSKGEA